MHRDQVRMVEKGIPLLAKIATSSVAEDIADCSVLNRLLLCGSDPLFLMETCPSAFHLLCSRMALSRGDGQKAIRLAHEQGPAALLCLSGLPIHAPREQIEQVWHDRADWRKEGLWLILAGVSEPVENHYGRLPITDRIAMATSTAIRFNSCVNDIRKNAECLTLALDALHRFESTVYVGTAPEGHAWVREDIGFYLAYKQGHKVCAQHRDDGSVRYGTVPYTSLDAEGIRVDKKVSEQFGIVFPPSKEG